MKASKTTFCTFVFALLVCTVPASAQGNGECDGLTTRTLTYSASAYSAASFSSELEQLRAAMQANPACRIVVSGSAGGSKVEQQMAWARVNAIISYMNEMHDVNRSRFIFQSDGRGSSNTVVIRGAKEGEDGPSSVPPPHPHLGRD